MIDERDLREMLARRLETISATPIDPREAAWLARRRLLRNALASLAGITIVIGGLASGRTIESAPRPRHDPPPELGMFADVRGSIAYGDASGIWAIDPADPEEAPLSLSPSEGGGDP